MIRKSLAILLLLAIGAGDALADGGRMRIPRDDCRRMVEHRPDPGIDYKPGTDVRGKAVPPADLPGGGLRLEPADEVEFDISFNPLQGGQAGRFGATELFVGTVRFNLKSGEATFNGVPLSDPQQAELSRKCSAILRGR
ncbi:MAG: hypothetical protein GEU87_13490 [Alphaproteobacteria bacterium]|nr:hypothetical protein [Alphaproteobacteria bacterium]